MILHVLLPFDTCPKWAHFRAEYLPLVSRPLQPSIRFLGHPLPAESWVFLTIHCPSTSGDWESTGLPDMVKSKLRFDSLKVSVKGNRSRLTMIVLKQIENVLVRFPCFFNFRSNSSEVAYYRQIEYLEDESRMDMIIGIDVSKESLDVYNLVSKVHQVFYNNLKGIKALIKAYDNNHPKKVIIESTGPYQRYLHKLLEEAGWVVSVVNPYKARCFAKSAGFLAKTDKVDSQMLALFGEKLSPKPTPYPTSIQEELESLVHYRDTRRRQLNLNILEYAPLGKI